MQITAAVLREGSGAFSLEPAELADPRPDEALVRMVAVGMCHTDLLARELPPEFFAGPMVYGHEGAGVVEAIGAEVEGIAPGDHVVCSFTSCRSCRACTGGRPAGCFDFLLHNLSGGRPDGTSALTSPDGERIGAHFFGQSSFASHAVVSQHSLVKVDPGADLRMLGPLGCGIQTGAGTVFNTLDVQAGTSIVIAGAGALGLSAVMAAVVAGADTIIAIDRHQSRLDLARELGATHVLTGNPDSFAAAIIEITGPGADYAFDTTGNAAVTRAILEGTNPIGILAMAGVGFGELCLDYGSLLSSRQIRGVMEGDAVPQEFIPRLIELHGDGRFPYDRLITTFPFEEINEAEAASLSGEVIKPVLLLD